MQTPVVFHEDVLYEYFRPFRHPRAHFHIWGGHGLETFGEDLQIVRSYPETFVWTVVDGCKGPSQWITPGIHFVNRICYLLTDIPHDWVAVEFHVKHHQHALTPLGLRRRISTLRRLLQDSAAN